MPPLDSTPAPERPAPRSLVSELALVASQLSEVVEEESDLLDKSRWSDMNQLCPRKNRLAMRYDALMQTVVTLPRDMIQMDPDCGRLKLAASKLDDAIRRNARKLQIHIQANRRVAEMVARAARNAAAPTLGYGGKRMGFGSRADSSMPAVAVTRLL